MTETQKLLWTKINDFELDDPDSTLTFSQRLARENGWTIEFSLRAVFEYKKFIFLLCIADHPLTPSDEVDQVWHLHLIYTQSYWEDFCEETLGRKIHHGPTKGGTSESDKYTDFYSKTMQFYTTIFGETPPKDLWPPAKIRFGQIRFQRINLDRYYLIKKPF